MWDTFKAIAAGFTGKLDHLPEARKLVWLLTLTFLAGWAATAFAAWISFKSYYSIIGAWMPGADVIAWFITITIACTMYYGLAYLSGYLVEIWKKVPRPVRDYSVLGARLMFVFVVCFGFLDFHMNLEGGKEIINQSAGGVVSADLPTLSAPTQQAIASDQKRLDDLLSGKLGSYVWYDKKGKKYYLNDSGKLLAKQLNQSIARQQEYMATVSTVAIEKAKAEEAQRQQYLTRNHQIVSFLVYFIYGIMGLLTLVQAYCTETIQIAARTSGTEGFQNLHAPVAETAIPRTTPDTVGFALAGQRTPKKGGTVSVQDESVKRPSLTREPCTCTYCGVEYIPKRDPRPGQSTFCCDDHRMTYWSARLAEQRAATKG